MAFRHCLRLSSALAGGLVLLLAACTPTQMPVESTASAPAPASASASVDVAPPIDLQAVIRRVRQSFRAESGAFTSGQETYSVRVDAAGTLQVSPRHVREGQGAPVTGSPLRVRTASVSRDGRSLAKAARTSVRDDGALALARGPLVEVLQNGDAGLEQRWELAARPEGSGDLEVRVELTGMEYVSETAQGHHFVDRQTGLGVRYGQATWVDAAGTRTPVASVREGPSLVLRVPARVLEASGYPAVLDPIISPELSPDAPVPAPTRNSEVGSAVAVGDGLFLVVWSANNGTDQDIMGTRVRISDGAVLDLTGLPLATGTGFQNYAAVASNGTDFLVTWDDGNNVSGVRVSGATGQRLGSTLSISSAASSQGFSAVAFDGTQYLVVWQDSRSNFSTDIYGARVRASDGVVLDVSGIPISTATGFQSSPAVSFDGSQFLVAWGDNRNDTSDDIYGARVSVAGTVLDPAGIAICTATNHQANPSIASVAGTFLVTWDDRRTGEYGIRGARVRRSDGAVLDPQGLALGSGTPLQSTSSSVASDGRRFLVVWQRGYASLADVWGARVEADGTVLEPGGVALTASTTHGELAPSAIFDGTRFTVLWDDLFGTRRDIFGVRVRASDLTVLDASPLLLSAVINAEGAPAVAAGTDSYLVVWHDTRDRLAFYDLYGVRVRASDGVVLDPVAIPIATGDHTQTNPAVGFAEGRFLVTWMDSAPGSSVDVNVHGVRIRESDGVVLDSPDIVVSAAARSQSNPKVASGDGLFFVTWEDARNGTGATTDVYGARVRALDGAVLDPNGIAVAKASANENSPATAFGAGYFLVAWADYRNGTLNPDIHAVRVRALDGTVADSQSLPLTTRAEAQRSPAVAFDGSHFLTVWQDSRTGFPSEVYGARVRAQDGAVLDGGGRAFFTNASNSKGTPALAFDGKAHLLVWRESTATALQLGGGRLAPDLSAVDATRFLISDLDTSLMSTTPLAVASWGRGRFLVAYEPHEARYAQLRAKFRLVSDPVNGAKCANGPDCTSGFCVEDVCCESACEGGTCGGGTCTYPSASITCPGDVVAEATRASGAPVSYPAASATGVLPLSVTYSQASGSEFAPGRTSVTARLVDGFGRTASCGFSVTVRDTTAPRLTCPGEVVAEAVGRTGAAVDFPAPTATDAVTAAPTLSLSQERGSTFPPGTTSVTATATDAAGNSASCSFPVTVRDTTPPSLACPADVTVEATSLQGATVTYAAASAADPVSDVTVEYSVASGSHFDVGGTQVRVLATDGAGNGASCTFTVTVSLPPPPTVTCPASLAVEATSLQGASVVYPPATPSGRGPLAVAYSQDSGTNFALGSTSVSATVTDGLGRTDICAFTVTVRDTQAPALVCGTDVVTEATGPSGATVAFPTPTATDAVTAEPRVALSHASGAVFPVGFTRVTVTAMDAAGNTSGCAFSVMVRDTTAPVLTCGADVVVEATGRTGTAVDFATPTAVDAVTSGPALVVSHEPGALFPLGVTRVSAKATDVAGNIGQCAFTVTVRDTTAPDVGCPAPLTVEAQDATGASVSFSVPAPRDTVTASPSVSLSQAPGSHFPLGTTEVVLSATDDAGNTASCSFTITLQDTTAPVLTCPSPVQKAEAPPEGLAVDYPAAIARDAASTPTLSYSHASGTVFPVGTTQVTVTAMDPSGNSATCTFPVSVAARVQPPPDEPLPSGGCGCGASSGTSAGLSWGGLMMLAWGVTRRRRSSAIRADAASGLGGVAQEDVRPRRVRLREVWRQAQGSWRTVSRGPGRAAGLDRRAR
ncbi:HYR domain-containing protein [Corallococcus llansteffanensis]|uniref:HYR domain-containing protein n=1 Tax=Corallococcus llansteffanensis TaxID=2316731 RepID=A0A3A8R0R7_9BACT|nr:HYR domain-containing protein [Corallococcus llansteffanensis]RKH68914.1 HYR domain-containing protein [Corallococcus llansteffanensis]